MWNAYLSNKVFKGKLYEIYIVTEEVKSTIEKSVCYGWSMSIVNLQIPERLLIKETNRIFETNDNMTNK